MADIVKVVLFLVVSYSMLWVIFRDRSADKSQVEESSKEIPVTNLGPSKYMGPSLKILYCYSCGYKNAFEQYADVLNKKYPEIIVEGGLYPPPGYNSLLARVLSLAKMLILFCIISGANLSQYLGRLAPTWAWCTTNKLYSCTMIFLICNIIEGQLISTGAFEITFNDVPVWSKLETGRIPQPPELFQIIDNQLRFQANTYETEQEINY